MSGEPSDPSAGVIIASTGGVQAVKPLSRLALAACLVLACLYFLSNGRTSSSGDNLGTRALATSIATTGSFDLSSALAEERPNYSVRRFGDRLRIAYPSGTGILASPTYFVASRIGHRTPASLLTDPRIEKAAAVLLSLLAVGCFLLLMNGRWSAGSTLAATALLVAGTPLSTTMSQGLWSHTGELLAVAACLLLTRAPGPQQGLASGLAAGFSVWCRPTAVLLFPLPLAMLDSRRERLRFAAGALVGIGALVLLNLAWYGSPAGAYGGDNQGRFDLLAGELPARFLGVLASPSRGLVWFFPALLVSLIALFRRTADDRQEKRIALALALVTTLFVLLVASFDRWWGGHSVGPRLLAELSLPCALAFGAALERTRRRSWQHVALLVAAAVQVFFSSLLFFSPRAEAWNVAVAIDANPAVRMSLKDSQLRAAIDPNWRYEEVGPYFDEAVLEQARSGFDWTPVELAVLANARYDPPRAAGIADEPATTLRLERLAAQPPPASSHLRVIAPGAANALRVCSGESSAAIPVGDTAAQKIDTLLQYRGSPDEAQQAAGFLIVAFANGRESRFPLRFGSHLLLRTQLNPEYARHRARFFAGSMAAPDALQRQRFSLPGKQRIVASLRLEMPADGPEGCLYLLAVSLGTSAAPAPRN